MESPLCADGDVGACRRLAAAFLLSTMVHVFVLATLGPVPRAPGAMATPSLQARLAVRDRASEVSAETVKSEPVLGAMVAPKVPSKRVSPVERSREQGAEAREPKNIAPDPSPVTTQAERPRSNPLASSGHQSAPVLASPAAAGRSAGFRYVEMSFELYADGERSSASTGRAVYSASDAHYGIAVQLAPAGTILAQDGPPSLTVSGVITPRGLSPEAFDARSGLAGSMLFPGRASKVAGEDREGARTGRFRDGLLDRQSLIYHFTLQPPNLGGGRVMLSDGKTYATYSYRVDSGGREILPPLGEIRVTRITLQPETASAGGGDRIELYLVPEMGYLPVRIRYTDESGSVTEQRVTSLVYR